MKENLINHTNKIGENIINHNKIEQDIINNSNKMQKDDINHSNKMEKDTINQNIKMEEDVINHNNEMEKDAINQNIKMAEDVITQNEKVEENLISQDDYFKDVTQLITEEDRVKAGYKVPKITISVNDFLNRSCTQPISTKTLRGDLINLEIPISSNFHEGGMFTNSIDRLSYEKPYLSNSYSPNKESGNQIISQINNNPYLHNDMVDQPFETLTGEIGENKLVVKRGKDNSFGRPGFYSATFSNDRFGSYPSEHVSIKYDPNNIDNINQKEQAQKQPKEHLQEQEQEQEQEREQERIQLKAHGKNQDNDSIIEEKQNKSSHEYSKMNYSLEFNQLKEQIICQK